MHDLPPNFNEKKTALFNSVLRNTESITCPELKFGDLYAVNQNETVTGVHPVVSMKENKICPELRIGD